MSEGFEILATWGLACTVMSLLFDKQPNFFIAEDGPLIMFGTALGIAVMKIWPHAFGF